jgi:hypothetical protein
MTPINTTPVKEGLAHLKGRQFAYCTKYNGMTFGTVVDIGITHTMRFDPRTENSIRRLMNSKAGSSDEMLSDAATEAPDQVKWAGTKIVPFIISDTGIRYSLDEIYILNMYDDKSE